MVASVCKFVYFYMVTYESSNCTGNMCENILDHSFKYSFLFIQAH